MRIFRMIRELFTVRDEDFVVVELRTKTIQTMNTKDWNRMPNKKNFMIIK